MDSKTEPKPFVIKGDICYSTSPQEVSCTQNGYLVCVDGKSAGVFGELPQSYAELPLVDCAGQLVVPGMSDIHVHAPQYAFRGLGMDLELLDWLNTHTFPEEASVILQWTNGSRKMRSSGYARFSSIACSAYWLLAMIVTFCGAMPSPPGRNCVYLGSV